MCMLQIVSADVHWTPLLCVFRTCRALGNPYSHYRLYHRLLCLPIANQCDSLRDCITYVDFVTCVVFCNHTHAVSDTAQSPLILICISYVIVLCVIRSGIEQSL